MNASLISWMLLFWWTALLLFAFDTTRRLAFKGLGVGNVARLFAVFVLLAVIVVARLVMATAVERIIGTFEASGSLVKLQNTKCLETLSARPEFESQAARIVFRATGLLNYVRDEHEGCRLYSPTQSEVIERELRVREISEITTRVANMRTQARQTIATTLFSMALGLLFGVSTRYVSHKRDARKN